MSPAAAGGAGQARAGHQVEPTQGQEGAGGPPAGVRLAWRLAWASTRFARWAVLCARTWRSHATVLDTLGPGLLKCGAQGFAAGVAWGASGQGVIRLHAL